MRHLFYTRTVLLLLFSLPLSAKESSSFFPQALVQVARDNCEYSSWASEIRCQMIEAARPFCEMSDSELWSLMFSNNLPRSWMVWSNGFCPSCKQNVPMYNWEINFHRHPWKVKCPHCQEIFPKNDFAKFYRSGINKSGIFDPNMADRSLLFNTKHPDPRDPLYDFGVDDGNGYFDGQNTWRFIAAYLIYGQWKQGVIEGIKALAEAYVVTGYQLYAHKAAILLDRVADLYPTFDFKKQGIVYECPGCDGYVSVWHDACEETRELAMAYDKIFDGLAENVKLVAFLSKMARENKLENNKDSLKKILENIESRIFCNALENPVKIYSNYPRKEIAEMVLWTVLGWPENHSQVFSLMDKTLQKATAVDGVTGEKGLANYSAFSIQALAGFIGLYQRIENNFFQDLIVSNPRLAETWRFHIDTWCHEKFYPNVGDSGWIGKKENSYLGVNFTKQPGLQPSMFTFLKNISETMKDPVYTQLLYLANGSRVDGLPYDLFAKDPLAFQKDVENTIEQFGSHLQLCSIDKQQWHIALLRMGSLENARTLWINYESGGAHGHKDGMNIGLFAKGVNLLPDFGYPPVQYGGWDNEKVLWYRSSEAHNTVTVDSVDLLNGAGKTTFWAIGQEAQAVRVEAPKMIGTSKDGNARLERNLLFVKIDEEDSYILDVIRVRGGYEHTRHLHFSFGTVETHGLLLEPSQESRGTVQRNFSQDKKPVSGWSINWKNENNIQALNQECQIGLKVFDFTRGATVLLGESWVSLGGFNSNEEAWVPQLKVRRSATSNTHIFESTFVSLMEPYEKVSKIKTAKRLGDETGSINSFDSVVTVQVEMQKGTVDTLYISDREMWVKRKLPNEPQRKLEWQVRE